MSDTLVNMFHHRIRYPWQEQRRVTGPNPVPTSPGLASISVRGTMSSAPPNVVERGAPSARAESGGAPPRDREPPPSIIVGPPLSLVPSPPSTPPSQETTSPSFPQKKS
jgi:hypothetical protein